VRLYPSAYRAYHWEGRLARSDCCRRGPHQLLSRVPHDWHLMAQPPQFEILKNRTKVACDGLHFLQVVGKTILPVIRNGIVVLAHVSQDTQEPLTLFSAGSIEDAVAARQQQLDDGAAILVDGAVSQRALRQLL